jgi:hypothetical protein
MNFIKDEIELKQILQDLVTKQFHFEPIIYGSLHYFQCWKHLTNEKSEFKQILLDTNLWEKIKYLYYKSNDRFN